MNNKDYFKNISLKLSFLAKYFRVFRLLIVIIYLFFLTILIINVFSAVEYVPSIDEVRGRFLQVKSKKEVINSIEKYFIDKKNILYENLQKEANNNPFADYRIDDLIPTENSNVMEVDIVN